MSRGILLAIAGGVVSGLLYLAVVTGSMGGVIFAYLSQVPLFAVGLGLGLPAALVAGAVAAAIIGIAAGAAPAGLLLATNIAPVCLLTRQALLNRPGRDAGTREWYPPGLLLAWAAAMAAAGVIVSAWFLAGHPEGIEAAIRAALAEVLGLMVPANQAAPVDTGEVAARFAPVFLGTVAASWMVMIAVNGSLAQGVLAGFGRNIRPSPALTEIEVPRWCYAALAACIVFAVVGGGSLGYIARNLAIAFTVPFFFQGLGVMHALIGRWTARTFAFVLFYIVLVVFVWPAVIVIAAGLAEPLVRMRRRAGGPREKE